jgi:hypothetical protein
MGVTSGKVRSRTAWLSSQCLGTLPNRAKVRYMIQNMIIARTRVAPVKEDLKRASDGKSYRGTYP